MIRQGSGETVFMFITELTGSTTLCTFLKAILNIDEYINSSLDVNKLSTIIAKKCVPNPCLSTKYCFHPLKVLYYVVNTNQDKSQGIQK